MKHLEDILDQAKSYIKGQMSVEEVNKFEQMLEEEPELKKEVAFASLMYEGLKEVAQEKKRTSLGKRKKWLVWGIILSMVGLVAYIFIKSTLFKSTPKEIPPQVEQVNENVSEPLSDPTLYPLGGDSENKSSDGGTAVARNSAGNIILTGKFEETITFDHLSLTSSGGRDIFMVLLDEDSKYLWAKRFGGLRNNDIPEDIAIDSKDNIIVTGAFSGTADFGDTLITAVGEMGNGPEDFFVAKYNANGKLLWIDHSGGNMIPDKQTGPNTGTAVTTDRFDNVIATGIYIGNPSLGVFTLPIGGPTEDTYLAKYSPDGNLIWLNAVTCDYNVFAKEVATDHEGNIYLVGAFGHHNVKNSAVTFNDTTLHSYGGRDIFLAKYSPNGTLAWAKHAGAPLFDQGKDYAESIVVDYQSNCLITGFFKEEAQFDTHIVSSAGGRDIFIAKCDANGNFLWVKRAGGPGDADDGHAIEVDADGNIYVAGTFSSKANFGPFFLESNGDEDGFIAKYDSMGKIQWVRQLGGELMERNSDGALSLAVNDDGEIVVTGFFSGTIHIGNWTLESSGKEDVYILRLDSDGYFLDMNRVEI